MANFIDSKDGPVSWEAIRPDLDITIQRTRPFSRRTLMIGTALTAGGMALVFDPSTRLVHAQYEHTPGVSPMGPRNNPNQSPMEDEYAIVFDPEAKSRLITTVMKPDSLRQIMDRVLDIPKDFRAEGYLIREKPPTRKEEPDKYGFKLAVGTLSKPAFLVTTKPFTEAEMLRLHLVAFSWKNGQLNEREVYGMDYENRPIDLKPQLHPLPNT